MLTNSEATTPSAARRPEPRELKRQGFLFIVAAFHRTLELSGVSYVSVTMIIITILIEKKTFFQKIKKME